MTDHDALTLIAGAIQEVTGKALEDLPTRNRDTDIRELGLDSIASLEVAGVLEERLERSFADDRLARVRSLGDLIVLVKDARP